MSDRLARLVGVVRAALVVPLGRVIAALARRARSVGSAAGRSRSKLVLAVLLACAGYALYRHPPFASVRRGEILVRTSAIDGSAAAYTSGTVLVIPGLHQARRYSTRDQLYRATEGASATGPAPFQSNEGLSIGVDLTVRWAIDRARIAQMSI